jgi:hypothetical protein
MATSSSSPTNGIPVESFTTTTERHSTTAIEPRLRASGQLTSKCIEQSFTRVPAWRARQMTWPIEIIAVLFVMTVAAWSVNTLAAGRTYAIDAERSRAVIAVVRQEPSRSLPAILGTSFSGDFIYDTNAPIVATGTKVQRFALDTGAARGSQRG